MLNNPLFNPFTANGPGQGGDSFVYGQKQQKTGVQPQFGLATASGPYNQAQGGDQLDAFRAQLQFGNYNLNQPALPYTATRGWSA